MADTYIHFYIVIILFGLLFGSFLNVCIYRIPRTHPQLTARSLAHLRGESTGNDMQDTQVPKIYAFILQYTRYLKGFMYKYLPGICHLLGWRLASHEPNIPADVLVKLEALKDQEYDTMNDFIMALEEHIGQDHTAQYGDEILKNVVFRKESVIFPSSHCPSCNVAIKPWDNIPVLSFILLRGKCRSCQTKISWRYPLVELLTAVLCVGFISHYGFFAVTFVYLGLFSALIVISCIDLEYQIIPDKISLPGIIVGIAMSVFLPISWDESILGALVGGGLIFAIGYVGTAIFKKEAMGGGDVKLMAMIGAFLGWKLAFLTIFCGSLIGAVVGIMMKIVTKKEYIPFGPFLSVGALLALLLGNQLFFWYWRLVSSPFINN